MAATIHPQCDHPQAVSFPHEGFNTQLLGMSVFSSWEDLRPGVVVMMGNCDGLGESGICGEDGQSSVEIMFTVNNLAS